MTLKELIEKMKADNISSTFFLESDYKSLVESGSINSYDRLVSFIWGLYSAKYIIDTDFHQLLNEAACILTSF